MEVVSRRMIGKRVPKRIRREKFHNGKSLTRVGGYPF